MPNHAGLDEQTRRSWYNPEAVLDNLKEGMTFVDVGCGEGFFSILGAKKVGVKGKVYAVDLDSQRVEKLKNWAKKEHLTNIEAYVGRAENTVFCRECADFILFSMDLHDFDVPSQVLENARAMIKATGILVDLDWKKISMEFGPPENIRFSEKQVVGMLDAAKFKVVSERSAGQYHYMITAKPK